MNNNLILNSCGSFEKEEIKEINIKYGYKILYDSNNIAFNFFSISCDSGTPIIDDCVEFFYDEKYLYVKQSPIKSKQFNYYKVNDETIEITKINIIQYKTTSKKRQLINFYTVIKQEFQQ